MKLRSTKRKPRTPGNKKPDDKVLKAMLKNYDEGYASSTALLKTIEEEENLEENEDGKGRDPV